MLDENLPTFFIKPSSDNERQSTIFLGQGGHDLQAEYTLRKPEPNVPESKNCYAVALYDSYNPEVLFAEVLVQPEWTQATLSQAEIRAHNGSPPPPVPVVPNSFTIQLYNPDQQVTIRQVAGSWNSSAHWEFEMPQQTFRMPSVSALDRSQSDPAASDTTPKIAFKWKRDGRLSKDITCFLSGKSTEGKKSKEPDITVAMLQHGKELTIYEPNMARVEVEDRKGLEVVFLLSSTVIQDIFFNASREMFNIGTVVPGAAPRKNSGGLPVTGRTNATLPIATGALPTPQKTPQKNFNTPQNLPTSYASASQAPPPQPPRRTQADIDAETARLLAQVQAEEKERDRQDRHEQKRIKKMLEQEDKERQKREAEVAKETERLRKQYGVQPVPDSPNSRVHFSQATHPGISSQSNPNGQYMPQQQPQPFPQFSSAPHSQPVPVQRPSSTPSTTPQSSGLFGKWWGPVASQPTPPAQQNNRPYRSAGSGSGPYLQAPTQGSASSSGFFSGGDSARNERRRLLGLPVEGEGGRKKVAKKRSVYF